MKATTQQRIRNQEGFVLITGLLVLLMLTVIMLTALRTAALEERMAGNLRNSNIAFQAAESALREAEGLMMLDEAFLPGDEEEGEEVAAVNEEDEEQVQDVNPFNPLRLTGGPFQQTGDVVCTKGFCGPASPPASDKIRDLALTDAVRTARTGLAIPQQPRYLVELLFVEPSTDSRRLYATFRVTTISRGEDVTSEIQLQSTYRAHVHSFVH